MCTGSHARCTWGCVRAHAPVQAPASYIALLQQEAPYCCRERHTECMYLNYVVTVLVLDAAPPAQALASRIALLQQEADSFGSAARTQLAEAEARSRRQLEVRRGRWQLTHAAEATNRGKQGGSGDRRQLDVSERHACMHGRVGADSDGDGLVGAWRMATAMYGTTSLWAVVVAVKAALG